MLLKLSQIMLLSAPDFISLFRKQKFDKTISETPLRMFNGFLQLGTTPSQWKIYKRKSPNEVENYHLIRFSVSR